MARREKKSDEGGVPAWIVTYGDMMSLLLTFFILLAAFSTIDQKKLSKAIMSMQGALGILPKNSSMFTIMPRPGSRKYKGERARQKMEKAARDFQRMMQIAGREDQIDVEFDKQGGIKIVLPNQVLFDTARADLRPESYGIFETLSDLLSELPGCFFEIRGHTDSRPLTSTARFRDNYDLSYARADAVARRLSGFGKLPIDQFEIVACGPGQPLAANDTEQGMQANRRVEIYVRGAPDSSDMKNLEGRLDAALNPAANEPATTP